MFIINNLRSRETSCLPCSINFFAVYDIDIYTDKGSIIPFHGVSKSELHDIIDKYIDDVQLINLTKI